MKEGEFLVNFTIIWGSTLSMSRDLSLRSKDEEEQIVKKLEEQHNRFKAQIHQIAE